MKLTGKFPDPLFILLRSAGVLGAVVWFASGLDGQSAGLPATSSTACLSVTCPTNKTVSCDATNWSFDLPVVVSSCCGTNYAIDVLGSDVTSNAGPCSVEVTRNWVITDCSGQSNFCSQTVTVSPPSSYTLTFRPGYNLIAYQFPTIGANAAFPNAGNRDFDELIFDSCTNQTVYIFDSASPSGFDDDNLNPTSAPTLSPGEGMFYQNNSSVPETVTFSGTPICPPSPSPLCPCGTLSLVSYELDCPGTYEDVTGLPPQAGAEVLFWNGTGYNTNTYTGTTWTLGPPVWNVGEAAFVLIPCLTNCLQLECATNKTLPCGTTWTFDPPQATSCCSNVMYTLSSSNLSSATPCQTVYAGVWQVTDGCGSATCTQLVTVVNSGSSVSTPGILLDYATLEDAGITFSGGGFSFVSNTNGYQFEVDDEFGGVGDAVGFDGYFSSSQPFGIGTININGAFQTAPVTNSGVLHISDGVQQLTGTIQWSDISTLGTSGVLNLNGVVNLTGITYAGGSQDLQSLVASGTASVDLTFQFIPGKTLSQLVTGGGFTDFSGTIVGSQILTTQPMMDCATNKTVPCGASWSFDPPVPVAGCCTNWIVAVLSTETNGSGTSCATDYTRTWQVTDCCSNAAVCSQTVTVAGCCTNCLTLTAPTNLMATTCSNCVPLNFLATATDACCSNVLISYSLGGQLIGTNYCFPIGTSTVLISASDACSNTASRDFTVTVLPCPDTNCIYLTPPAGMTNMICGSNCAPVNFSVSAFDYCCSNLNLSYQFNGTPINTNYCFPAGLSTVTVLASDDCSNTASCQFTVTVISVTNPPAFLAAPTNVVLCEGTKLSGAVIVDGDEWDNSDAGFLDEGYANGALYVTNCANYLTSNGGNGTNILICSDDFSYTRTDMIASLTAGGFNVTRIPPPLPGSLSGYSAVYVGGDVLTTPELDELQAFVCSGGGLYIAAGTGIPNEAAQWNSILNGFGLNLATNYNGIIANLTVPVSLQTTASPVMAGITVIYNESGNDVNTLAGYPSAQIVASDGGEGIIGVSACVTSGSGGSGGCALMPDLSGEVAAVGGTFAQSILPGTLICADTNVTLVISNACGFTNRTIPVILVNCASNCLQVQSPSDIVVTSCTNIPVTYSLSVTDLCCTNWTLTFTPPSGSPFVPGTITTVTALATDTCGNTNLQSFTVTVLPGAPCATNCLVIQCWTNIVLTSCTNVPVDYDPVILSVCCTNSVLTCTPPSGSFFAPNTTNTVSCVATDACGHVESCSFTVTVLNEPAIAQGPAEIPLCANTNGCGVMPDATAQIWLSVPPGPLWVQGSDATVSQSMPPGTILCHNTNVTFSIAGSCGPTSISVPVVLLPYGCCCEASGVNLQFLDFPAPTVPVVSGNRLTLPGYGSVQVAWTCAAPNYAVSYGAGIPGTTQPQFTYGDPYGNPYATGGYSWTSVPNLGVYDTNLAAPSYTVTFTFQNGPPDPSRLFLCVAGMYDTTTAIVSQPGYLAGEYQAPIPNCGGCDFGSPYVSAVTLLDSVTETPGVPGAPGYILSSAYDPIGVYQNLGDQRNTGYALFQVTSNVTANVLTVTMHQVPGDGLALSLAYEVNPCPPLVSYCPTNIDVCISNLDGCGTMPDVTWLLQVAAGAQVAQNIPPGTTLCSNTNLIFTVTNGCLATNLVVPVRLLPCTNECLQLGCPDDIAVTTCSNCAVVNFQATVTDPCCSNEIAINYDPAPNTCFPVGVNPVKVTAYDACGNTATCSFTVTVFSGSCRPIISVGPTNFVLCAGTNGCATMPDEVHGSSPLIYALYNTALAATILPEPLPAGAVSDAHWTLASAPALPPTSPLEFGTNTALQVNSSPNWAAADNLSGWIAPANDANNDAPEGNYDYQTTFILPQDGNVTISGQLAAAGYVADVLLNGASTGVSITNGAAELSPFTVAGGGLAGTNTLDFIVHNNPLIGIDPPADNQDSPSGLLVEFTTVSTLPLNPYIPPAVQATNCDGTPAPGGQSIPPGTRLCNDTNITFTFTNACGETTSYVASVTVETCCVQPPAGMVLWLTWDETVGDTCLNSAGYNNGLRYDKNVMATSANGPSHNLGEYVGNSLCFDGLDDEVEVPNYSAIDLASNNFTLDAWVKWNGGEDIEDLVDHRVQSSGYTGYVWYLSNGKPAVDLDHGSVVSFVSTNRMPANVWTHLAATVQRGKPNTTVTFYVDGAVSEVKNLTGPNGSLSNSAVLWIGNTPLPGGGQFYGCMDELEIFDLALAPYEIFDIYAAGHTGKCRPTCSVPAVSTICHGVTNLVVSVQVCNCGSSTMTFDVEFNALSAAQAGGSPAVNGPTGYSHYPATVTLPPNGCTNFDVTIQVPALGYSQVCYYQMTIKDMNGSGQQFSSIGKIQDPLTLYSYNCDPVVSLGTNVVQVALASNFVFAVNNPTNAPLTLNTMVLVVDGNLLPETNLVSLNGLPPGTPVTNQIVIPPLGSQPVNVNISYLDSQPWQPFNLLLFLNIGDDGAFIPVASATFAQVVPPTVGPPLSTSFANGQLVVSWDMVNSGWVLNSTPTLTGTNWIPVHVPVLPLSDGSQGITLPLTNQTLFFRLQGPNSP